MNILITGGAGFIGSHLADKLLANGNRIICADKLVFNNKNNIVHLLGNENFVFEEIELADQVNTDHLFEKYLIDVVYHLAANSEIQKGGLEPNVDFNDTFMTTRCLLESMRKYGAKNIFFASTSAVYGEMVDMVLKETTGGIMPISYYGGAKLASEAIISSYVSMSDIKAVVFRFPNVIGPRLTHGVIFDFIKKLRNNPKKLKILGGGTQCKPYIYVLDLIEAIYALTQEWKTGQIVYNLGIEGEGTTVTEIAKIVVDVLGLEDVEFCYSGGDRGWKGDVPRFKYDIYKILSTGWTPKYTSNEAVRKTVEDVVNASI